VVQPMIEPTVELVVQFCMMQHGVVQLIARS